MSNYLESNIFNLENLSNGTLLLCILLFLQRASRWVYFHLGEKKIIRWTEALVPSGRKFSHFSNCRFLLFFTLSFLDTTSHNWAGDVHMVEKASEDRTRPRETSRKWLSCAAMWTEDVESNVPRSGTWQNWTNTRVATRKFQCWNPYTTLGGLKFEQPSIKHKI